MIGCFVRMGGALLIISTIDESQRAADFIDTAQQARICPFNSGYD